MSTIQAAADAQEYEPADDQDQYDEYREHPYAGIPGPADDLADAYDRENDYRNHDQGGKYQG